MPFDNTGKKSGAPKTKWRDLAPELNTMSVEKAIVLALHHLELAEAMFNCIEPATAPDDPRLVHNYDDPDVDEANNQTRLKYALAALEKRYPAGTTNGVFRAGAKAFLETVIATQDRENREWLERAPIVEIEGPPEPKAET